MKRSYKEYNNDRIDKIIDSVQSVDNEIIDDRFSLMPDKTRIRHLEKRRKKLAEAAAVAENFQEQQQEDNSAMDLDNLDGNLDNQVALDEDCNLELIYGLDDGAEDLDLNLEVEGAEDEDDDENIAPSANETEEEKKTEEEEEEEDEGTEDVQLLFKEILTRVENQTCTREEFVFDILKIYVTKKNCTQALLTAFIQVLNKALKDEDKLPPTADAFFNELDKIIPPSKIQRCFYCSDCEKQVEINDGKDKTCQNCNGANITPFFILDVAQQIRTLFENSAISAQLKEIKNGDELLRFRKKLRGKYDLLLAMNSDGLQLVKSRKDECWPVFFSMLQLPAGLRDRSIILGGLWHSTRKPPMNIFLRPIVLQIRRIFKYGFKWTNPIGNTTERTRVGVPLIIGDCPGRCEMGNFSYFSGTFGCQVCEIKTTIERDERGKRVGGRIYNYSANDQMRTEDSIKRCANRAAHLNKGVRDKKKLKKVRGIKGRSILAALPLINMSKCFISELMHAFCLGAERQFLKKIFFEKGDFSLAGRLEEFNQFMSEITPPSFVHRRPRPLTENLKFMKASEILFIFLFYSVPFFRGRLKPKYFDHYLLLVKGISLLLPETLTEDDISNAQAYLNKYVEQAASLYGNTYMTYNVHQLIHLPGFARDFGSLQQTWAFPFETENFNIARGVHGTRHFGMEIVKKISCSRALTALDCKLHGVGDDCGKSRDGFRWEDPKFSAGNKMNEAEKNFIIENKLNSENFALVNKVKINGKIYTSRLYKDNLKANDFNVQIFWGSGKRDYSLGAISFFLIDETSNDLLILLNLFAVDYSKLFKTSDWTCCIPHILHVKKTDQFKIYKLNEIKDLKHVIPVHDYVVLQLFDMRKNL